MLSFFGVGNGGTFCWTNIFPEKMPLEENCMFRHIELSNWQVVCTMVPLVVLQKRCQKRELWVPELPESLITVSKTLPQRVNSWICWRHCSLMLRHIRYIMILMAKIIPIDQATLKMEYHSECSSSTVLGSSFSLSSIMPSTPFLVMNCLLPDDIFKQSYRTL